MSQNRPMKHTGANSDRSAHNHKFEPRAAFEFQENMHSFENDSAPFDSFGDGAMDFDLEMFDENLGNDAYSGQSNFFPVDSDGFVQNMPNLDPSSISQYGNPWHENLGIGGQLAAPLAPQSAQSNIVSKRKDRVNQQFGQITPPDMVTPAPNASDLAEGAQESPADIAKINRAERARNAANKRHSKSKKRKDSAQDEEVDDGEDEDGLNKSTSVQREKNRVAAAKCRAKKKANSEEMQDIHREGSRRHSFLLREMRELRDQKAFLRNTLLQHDPDICQCHAIHRFNLAQAQQLAMGVGGLMPPPASPSQESASSTHTPGSDGSAGRQFSIASPSAGTAQQNKQSSTHSLSHYPSQSDVPGSMHLPSNAGQDPSQIPPFTDFMHSSPGGRRGFQ